MKYIPVILNIAVASMSCHAGREETPSLVVASTANEARPRKTSSPPVPPPSLTCVTPDGCQLTPALDSVSTTVAVVLSRTIDNFDPENMIAAEEWSPGWRGQSDDTGWQEIDADGEHYRYRYHWARDALQLSFRAGGVHAMTAVHYFMDAQIHRQFIWPIGWLWLGGRCGHDGETPRTMILDVDGTATIGDDWNIAVSLAPSTTPVDQCVIGLPWPLSIVVRPRNITAMVANRLRDQMSALIQDKILALTRAIAPAVTVGELWKDLSSIHSEGNFHVSLAPRDVYIQPLNMTLNGHSLRLELPMAVTFSPVITTESSTYAAPASTPPPPPRRSNPPMAEFHVAIRLAVDYQNLTRKLSSALGIGTSRAMLDHGSAGRKHIVVDDVAVNAYCPCSGKLSLGVKLHSRNGAIDQVLWFVATPTIDMERRTLSFPDIDFIDASWEVFKSEVPFIERKDVTAAMRSRVIDLSTWSEPYVDQLASTVVQRAFPSSLGGLAARLDQLRLESLKPRPTPANLLLDAVVTGRIELAIH